MFGLRPTASRLVDGLVETERALVDVRATGEADRRGHAPPSGANEPSGG
jgi:hypothetical protein